MGDLTEKIDARLPYYSQQAATDIRDLIVALRVAEDERARFEFEADEATKKLLSARIDALNEAATLCEHRSKARSQRHPTAQVNYQFAGKLARDIRALALPVRGSDQDQEER